jgi:hypothetical protein
MDFPLAFAFNCTLEALLEPSFPPVLAWSRRTRTTFKFGICQSDSHEDCTDKAFHDKYNL